MIIYKGDYKDIRIGICKAYITKKAKSIPVYGLDKQGKIGTAVIKEDSPLTVDITFDIDFEVEGSYILVKPMNYTQQNGIIIDISALKLYKSVDEYLPYILETDTFREIAK